MIIRFFRAGHVFEEGTVGLHDVSIEIPEGAFVYLTGPSGAGKSTFLGLVFGAIKPSEGQVVVAGRNTLRLDRDTLPLLRREIGFLFQDYRLIGDVTARENVALALIASGVAPREANARADEALERVDLAERTETIVRTLSGGEKQRVALARALIHKPKIILADEPTGNLDLRRAEEVYRILEEAAADGATVLIATHDADRVLESKHPAIHLEAGRLSGMRGLEAPK